MESNERRFKMTKEQRKKELLSRDFKGIWIPKELYFNDTLGWTEKLLLIEIDSLDQDKGCYASNDYFSTFLGVTNTRVSKMISKLKKRGLITQAGFDGRKRFLRSNMKLGLS